MEPRQEEKKRPSRAELEAMVLEFRGLVGDKLKGHRDGDAEEFLFKAYRRRGSHANH
ncbi:MAG: hypothetical protein JRN17_04950 [Nitrososphaerota archaeon]|nr:hypothetical protein [Nitrososphaerota archaeon]